MQQAALQAISRGLVTCVTSLMSDRATKLGGSHLHSVFCILVTRSAMNLHRIAEIAIIKLHRNPALLHFLIIVDIIFVDEMGQVPAQMWSVINIIMRTIRNSSLLMGGAVFICTLDVAQLSPIDGLPFLMTPDIVTSFITDELHVSFRSRNDANLTEINRLARNPNNTEEDLDRFESLIIEHCNHYDTWEDPAICHDKLHVFGRKLAVAEGEATFLALIKKPVPTRIQMQRTVTAFRGGPRT